MIAVVQRVLTASVSINNIKKSEINDLGLLIFLCITKKDSKKDAETLYNKITNFRIFSDNRKNMNLSIKDIKGSVMIVSQFTLCGNVNSGRRPSFENAAKPLEAKKLYNNFISMFEKANLNVKTGKFGANMNVNLTNNGPITFYFNTNNDEK